MDTPKRFNLFEFARRAASMALAKVAKFTHLATPLLVETSRSAV
jgi:hypothetical protein